MIGSHGGATPEGQAEMLAGFSISEETMGVPIDAFMDVEPIGELEPGLPIYVCKSALAADGIVIIPRIKPHTASLRNVRYLMLRKNLTGFHWASGWLT